MVSGRSPFLLAVLSFTATAWAGVQQFQSRHVTLPRRPTEFTTIPQAGFSIPLAGRVPRRQVKKDKLKFLRGGNSTTAVLAGGSFDQEYLVNVTVGGQDFAMILDTGSSDTWLPTINFTCLGLDSEVQPESKCAFGALFYNTSSTFSPIPNLHMNVSYEDYQYLLGTVANETITIAGLTVQQQEIGVVYEVAWNGDGISSGIIGFAYPDATAVYVGDDPANDIWNATYSNHITYDPFFFSAVREGAVSAPFFSLALNRGTFDAQLNDPYDPNLGFLALGGLPPVPVTNASVTVPVQGYLLSGFAPSNSSDAVNLVYTVDVQAFKFPGSDKLDTFNNNTVIDSGTSLNYLAPDVAVAWAAAFDPPAIFDPNQVAFAVQCNATIPELIITIAGVDFTIDPRDQIVPGVNDSVGNPTCILGTQDGGPVAKGSVTLGDTFLHNVVVTFNIESNELTITQRESY